MSRTKATEPTTTPATKAPRGLGEEDTVGEDGDELVKGVTSEEDSGGDVVGVTARFGLLGRLVYCVETQTTSRT